MVDKNLWLDSPADEDSRPVLARRPIKETFDLDITPMIDITFLLLIFFLVASRPDLQVQVELPSARHGVAVSARYATIVTIARGDRPGQVAVYLADGKVGTPLPNNAAAQEEEIGNRVSARLEEGKVTVLVKAERDVPHREVARVVKAAAAEGIQLHLAVFDAE